MSDRFVGEDWRERTARLTIDADDDELVPDGEDTVMITQSVPSGETGEGTLFVDGDGIDVPVEDGHSEEITTTDDGVGSILVEIRADGFTPDTVEIEVTDDA